MIPIERTPTSRISTARARLALLHGCSLALCLAPAWAHADDAGANGVRSSGPSIGAAIPGATLAETILVGPSGQLYRPAGERRWQRSTAGGVAVDVHSAARLSSGRLMVAGKRSPLYRFESDAWHAHHLSQRGPVLLTAAGGVPILAVGRHLMQWRDGSWQRMAQSRGRLSAVWASSPDRVYAALTRGVLDKWNKGSWQRLQSPLAKGEAVVRFAGRPGRKLYAFSERGAVLDVGARRARAIPVAEELRGLEIHAATVARDGTLWVVGVTRPAQPATEADPAAPDPAVAPTPPAPARAVLARRPSRGNQPLALAEPLAGIDANDRISILLTDDTGSLLVATRAGRIHIRDDSGAWTQGQLAETLPTRTPAPSASPARTR